MFHIVFDSGGAKLLSAAMDLDEALDGEIILIGDDYSVGPIGDLFSESGQLERKKWWNKIREVESETVPEESDDSVLRKIIQRMEEEEFDQVWIWIAPNIKDVSGYYWLISQLGQFTGRIYLLSLNNLPFIHDKGHIFYPRSMAEIPAREFTKAKKLARPVTPAEFETDPDEWIRLASENKDLRLLEGGKKITQPEIDYFDKSILKFLQPGFQKIPRTVHHFITKSTETVNEFFLCWRLKQLVQEGYAEQQGDTVRLLQGTADTING
jgi:hypothetical protein